MPGNRIIVAAQYRQNPLRPLSGSPVLSLLLMFFLMSQAVFALPLDTGDSLSGQAAHHDHPALHSSEPVRSVDASGGHTAGHEDCCEVECQDCAMGSCSSLTQSRAPVPLHPAGGHRFASLDITAFEPPLGGLYRPPITR